MENVAYVCHVVMAEKITNVVLKFACNQNLAGMRHTAAGKFCNACNKTVYDFTGTKADEFRKILSEVPNVCGMFTTDQVVSVGRALPLWKKWISAALVLIGINIIDKAEAQIIITDSATNNFKQDTSSRIFGAVEQSAEYPGGLDKFAIFLTSNIRYSGNKTGRVIVQFDVRIDGKLSDFKIVRGVSEEADAEALRVLRLSPKWKPAIRNGKAIQQTYTVPVTWKPFN